jgi:hypothetical protein
MKQREVGGWAKVDWHLAQLKQMDVAQARLVAPNQTDLVRLFDVRNDLIMINMLMLVRYNSFTHLSALLVLTDRGILAHSVSLP